MPSTPPRDHLPVPPVGGGMPPRRALRRLLVALGMLALWTALLWLSGWFALPLLLTLLLALLYWLDLGRAIRAARHPSPWMRALGLLMGVPQALLGLLSCAIGLGLIGWVLYNSLVERQPGYSGGWLSVGIGPALLLIGGGWLVSAFRADAGDT
jgi:hypothetical protein